MSIFWRRNFVLRFTKGPMTQRMFEAVPYSTRTVQDLDMK